MNSNSNNFREMFWDESNRLRVVYDQNSYQMQHYIYDAAGERTLKASSKIENVYENGQVESNNTTMGLYTTYVSPYMVVDANQKYSKHYFNGTQRVASKIGEQDIAIFENGNQYLKQANSKAAENTPATDFDTLKNKQITDFSYYLSKSTKNATAKNLKVKYTEYKKVDTNAETTSAKAADNNSTYAAPQYAELYYYHSDHLGTGTFLSDFDGNPYQFFLNLPFGETMAEQHSYSGEYTNRYKFNGKELDEETGFYYYGARYYNPKFSIWLSTDPLAEKMPSWSPYSFCFNSPLKFVDFDGRIPYPITIRAFAPFNSFGGGFHGDGAKRGFTTSSSATARVHQKINFDTDKTTMTTTAWSSPSSHKVLPGSATATPSVEFSEGLKITKKGNEKTFDFGTHVAASNPMVPGSPPIDVFSDFSITENKKAGTLDISGTLKGDNFPSTEAFITDPNGQSLFIGVGYYEGSPFSSLDGENKRDISSFDFSITTDKNGNFTGVKMNDKTYSIKDWNKMFQTADPHKNESK